MFCGRRYVSKFRHDSRRLRATSTSRSPSRQTSARRCRNDATIFIITGKIKLIKKIDKDNKFFFISFFGDFGLSQLTSFQFIQSYVAGFYKLTIPQSPPSHLRDYSTCNNARLEFFHNFCSRLLIQMNGA